MGGVFRGREATIGVGGAALQTFAEPLQLRGGEANSWTNLIIPRASLLRRFGDIESRLAKEIGPGNEAMAMLSAYCRMIERIGTPSTPDLLQHATDTVLDLVGLATGATGEPAELARSRGLRSARVLAIIARISLRYADPNFSAAQMAAQLQLSPRYVQELLQESGIGFSQRVLELRLRKAFDMLVDATFDHLRIAQIAYSAGFSDVSYFNRSFRRRFGCTPNAARSS
jgi:AraC-like DNA-binding protein